jgi:hypothetical protein
MTNEIAGIPKKRDGRVKIDQQELIALATARKGDGSPFTHQEMARHLGVTRPAVTRALAKIPKSVLASHDVQTFRKNRADIFADMQRMILTYMTPEKLKGASINQLGTLFGIVYDKERLEKGQATAHVAQINRSMLDDESLKKVRQIVADITQKKIAEAKSESLAISKGDSFE